MSTAQTTTTPTPLERFVEAATNNDQLVIEEILKLAASKPAMQLLGYQIELEDPFSNIVNVKPIRFGVGADLQEQSGVGIICRDPLPTLASIGGLEKGGITIFLTEKAARNVADQVSILRSSGF